MRAALLVILLFSFGAHADVFDSYNHAYQKAIDQITSQADSNATAEQKALAQENAAAQALQTRQQKESQDLTDAESRIATLQQSQKELQLRVNNPLPNDTHRFLFWHVQGRQQRENHADQRQLQQVTQELATQQSRVKTMQSEIQQRSTQISDEAAKLQTAQQISAAATANARNLSTDQKVQLQQATIQANSLFTRQKMNGFQSKLLLSDLNQLQTEGTLTSVEVQALKNASDSQLNNTLMGHYVNSQIEKAVAATCSPDFQSSCASKQAGDVTNYLNQKLNAPAAQGAAVPSTQVNQDDGVKIYPYGTAPAPTDGALTNAGTVTK